MIGMNKSGCNEPVVLLPVTDHIGIHHELSHQVVVAIGSKADEDSNTNDNIGYRHRGQAGVTAALFKVVEENNGGCKGRFFVVLDFEFGKQLSLGDTAQVGERLQRYL